ncbi:MAG: flagellar assembly protein FliW [Thermoleophilia bacterium]|nr:flagellar assembly protein FliW [Thermoleophilia bacterium]
MSTMNVPAVAPASGARIAIRSRQLGDIEFDAADVISFCEPVLGFAECDRYVLIPHTLPDGTASDTIMWLQAVTAPYHAFIVTDPWGAVADYAPEISDADADQLGLTRFQDATVVAILTVPGEGAMTINLRAPIVFNAVNRTAKQVVLLSDQYHSRHPLA